MIGRIILTENDFQPREKHKHTHIFTTVTCQIFVSRGPTAQKQQRYTYLDLRARCCNYIRDFSTDRNDRSENFSLTRVTSKHAFSVQNVKVNSLFIRVLSRGVACFPGIMTIVRSPFQDLSKRAQLSNDGLLRRR